MAAKKKVAKKSVGKAKALKPHEKIAAAMEKKFGAGATTTLQREKKAVAQIKEYIPLGIDALDRYVIGRGGLPIGRMIEVFGEEGCGKTLLLYRALAQVQRMGGVAHLLDAEFAFEEERAEVSGVDQDTLLISYPKHLEECLDMIKHAARTHNPKDGPLLIGLDSIASLKTKSGVALDAGEAGYRGEAKLFSDELRDMARILTAHRACLFMTNQIRHKMNVRFGSNITTPGGNAPKFYSSVRLQFFGGKALKNKDDEHTGKVVTIVAIKNRLQAPFKKAKVRLDYATGYNDMWTTTEHAKRLGLIKPRKKDGKTEPLSEQYLDSLEELDWPFNSLNDHEHTVGALREDDSFEEDDDEGGDDE